MGTWHGNSPCTYSCLYLFTSDRHCAGDDEIPNFCDIKQVQNNCSLTGPQGPVLCLLGITLHGLGQLQSVETNNEENPALSDSCQEPAKALGTLASAVNFFSHPRKLCSKSALIEHSCVTLDKAAGKTTDSQKSHMGRLSDLKIRIRPLSLVLT